MKKLTIYILAAGLFATTSCEKFLDITPEGQVKRDELLSTASGVEDALYGVYAKLRSPYLYGEYLSYRILDLMAHYFSVNYNEYEVPPLQSFDYANTYTVEIFESIWTTMYNNISNVNSIINCDLLQKNSGYPYDIYMGEALGLRAFMHFDLLRLYTDEITRNPEADGIPYATEFSLVTPDFKKAKEDYRLVINDLRRAEKLLQDDDEYENTTNFMTERKIHFNKYAAQATLARVYLALGEKDSAAYYAEKVIQNSGRTLVEKAETKNDLAGILSNKETIFGVYYAGFFTTVNSRLQQHTDRYSLDPRNGIKEMYSATDYRPDAYFSGGEGTSMRFIKLTDTYELNGISGSRPSNLILGINLIRLPEMYYIAAEALAESDPARAAELLLYVMSRRMDIPELPDADKLVEAIDDERYKEFIGEGQTFYNMKRRNLPILDVDGTTYHRPSNAIFTVPIPDVEYENRY